MSKKGPPYDQSLLADFLRLQHKIAEKQLDLIHFYFEKCVWSVWVLDHVNQQNAKPNPIFILTIIRLFIGEVKQWLTGQRKGI